MSIAVRLRELMNRRPRCRARQLAASLVGVCVLAGGCASNSNGPEVLTISAADYPQAFDAAVEVARKEGMPSTLRDRRGGVIETLPRMAGSILEPWRTDNASVDQSIENTIAFQRRRARFEFVPVGFNPPDDLTATDLLEGPDVLNAESPLLDVSKTTGELELRVWVYLERASIAGIRRSTWTRSKSTQTLLVYPEGMKDRKGPIVNWTPVARDPAYERRLLHQVQQTLMAGRDPLPATPEEPASQPARQPLAMANEHSGATTH